MPDFYKTAEVDGAFAQLDSNMDGSIGFGEYQQMALSQGVNPPQIKADFQNMDSDRNGRLSKMEIQNGLSFDPPKKP